MVTPTEQSPGPNIMPSVSEIFEAQERLMSSLFDQAKAYSQVVLGIGYVSIFASWAFTKDFLSKNEVFWSALLVSLSIFVFVIFEVLSMFLTSRTLLGVAEAVQNPAQFSAILEKRRKADAKLFKGYARSWVWCWAFSVLTGVGSAFILLGAFIGHLWAEYAG